MPAIFKNNKNYGGNSPLIINDESYSIERVWSSDKVNSELLKLGNELKELIGEEDKVEITYEDYNNLTDEEKVNGKVYYITDKSIVAFKGVEYGGDVKVKELTAAEYEALSEEEQKNGTIYFVTDIDENDDITGYTGGTGIEIDENKMISLNTSVISNPNIADNPDFKINQRSLTKYETVNSMTVDRWYQDSRTNTEILENGNIRITALTDSSEGWWGLSQIIEKYNEDEVHTFSVKVAAVSGNWYIGGKSDIRKTLTLGINTHTDFIMPHGNYGRVGIALNNVVAGDYIELEWIKIEQGQIATPFIPPHPAEELIKCKRYYQRIKTKRERMWMYNTNQLTFFLEYSEMRTNPIATVVGTPTIIDLKGATLSDFTFSIGWCDLTGLRIDAVKTTHNLTDAVLVINSSNGDYIELSADL